MAVVKNGFDFILEEAKKVTGNTYEYVDGDDKSFGRVVENGKTVIFHGSKKDAETFLAGFIQGYKSANQWLTNLVHPKKATSYTRLNKLLSGLRGSRVATDCQEEFDGYVRFVKRNSAAFTVALLGKSCLFFDCDRANNELCLSLAMDYSPEKDSFVCEKYFFPANEDIAESLATTIKREWENATAEKAVG